MKLSLGTGVSRSLATDGPRLSCGGFYPGLLPRPSAVISLCSGTVRRQQRLHGQAREEVRGRGSVPEGWVHPLGQRVGTEGALGECAIISGGVCGCRCTPRSAGPVKAPEQRLRPLAPISSLHHHLLPPLPVRENRTELPGEGRGQGVNRLPGGTAGFL